MDLPLVTIDRPSRFGRLLLLSLLGLISISGACVRAQTAGSWDTTFKTWVTGGLNSVTCALVQADGKIVLGGSFDSAGSLTQSVSRNNIARLKADGSSDTGFDPGTGANGAVDCVAVQTDGKILVGGNFTTMNGQTQARLCRLNADGSLDTAFAPGIAGGDVLCVAIQADGKIIAAGGFTSVNGTTQSRITRLNIDGTIDPSFSGAASTDGQINSIAVQPDGNIIVGGLFTTINGSPSVCIGRFTGSGLLDGTFHPGTGVSGNVNCVLLQPDGKVVIAGSFTAVNGNARAGIARLSSLGALESTATFANPTSAANGPINCLALQTDGKIMIGGNFTSFGGSFHGRLVRLSSSGALESTSAFSPPSFNAPIYSVTLQGDGKIFCGGSFLLGTTFSLARLANDTVTQTLTIPNASLVQWSRGGACPEVWNATFEISTDRGTNWSLIGSASRMTGGWQMTGLSLPVSGHLRARGQVFGGYGAGGMSFIEQILPFGGVSSLPLSNTLGATLIVTSTISLTTYTATLQGSVNALGNSTTVTFQYGTTTAYGSTATAGGSPVSGSTLTPVTAAITMFGPHATYHYRIVATSSAGTTFGNDVTVTTPNNNAGLSALSVTGSTLFPSFSSLSGGGVYYAVVSSGDTSAIINSILKDLNATVSINGSILPPGVSSAVVSVVPGNNSVPIVVTAQDGITKATYSLTITVPTVPKAATSHSDVADTYATLKASVSAMDTTASVTFQYGLDTNYGATVSGPNVSYGFTSVPGATVTGLVPGATYHYRVTVTNSQGSVTSDDATFTTYLVAPPGSIDNRFNASTSGTTYATATQPDGRIVVAGSFGRIARLNSNGTLDTSFTATANSSVECLAVQADGKILIGGTFSVVNGVAKKNLARLNSDGSLDGSFVGSPDSEVVVITLQPDGNILIGGFFSSVGATSQESVARLNALDGSLDATFAPAVNVWVNSVALQTDGKIILGGWFTTVNGAAAARLVRLNSNGTTDPSFSASANSPVDCVAVQADGKIIVSGWFTTVNSTTRNRIARLNDDGTLDANFDPNASNEVYTVTTQADGKILLGGLFTTVGGAARNYIARLNSDGSLDLLFDPDASSWVYSIVAQANGEVLVGGTFSTMFGQSHDGLALLINDPATQALSMPDLTQIQWTRGGTQPESSVVTFDLSVDGGNSWSSLGSGVRVSGGWRLTGLNLPSSGLVRARAWLTGSRDGSGAGIVEQDLSYPPGPQIFVDQPVGTVLISGGNAVDFGQLVVGASASRTFTIRNAGDADLGSLAIALDGANAADFSITGTPVSPVAAGGSTTFTLQFAPGALGTRSAAMHLTSNAIGINNPFSLPLSGAGLTILEGWRLKWFGTTAAGGNTADTADPDADGLSNLLEFATGGNPAQAGAVPGQLVRNGGNLEFTYQRSDAALTTGITFVVEWSDTLLSGSWSQSGITETVLSDDGTTQMVRDVIPAGANGQRFVHLRVSH